MYEIRGSCPATRTAMANGQRQIWKEKVNLWWAATCKRMYGNHFWCFLHNSDLIIARRRLCSPASCSAANLVAQNEAATHGRGRVIHLFIRLFVYLFIFAFTYLFFQRTRPTLPVRFPPPGAHTFGGQASEEQQVCAVRLSR